MARSWLLLSAFAAAAATAGGCAGPIQPMVAPTLSARPEDPEKRRDLSDAAAARRGPEHQAKSSRRLHQLETAAATAAGILGILLSASPNAVIGVGAPIDENRLVDPAAAAPPKRSERPDEATAVEPAPVFGPVLEEPSDDQAR